MMRACFAAVFALVLVLPAAARAEDPEAETETAPQAEAPVVMEAPRTTLPALVMLIGGGARLRDIRLDVGAVGGGSERRGVETGTYFDFGWHLLIRPMAHRSPNPALQAIVIQIDGGSAIGLEVQPADVEGKLQTNVWRLLGQVGYLYPRRKARFGGLVGIGADVFDVEANPIVPSSRIVYVRLGPAAACDLVRHFLSIRGDFGVRAPFLLGELEDAFGNRSRAVGLDATLTLDGRLEAGFTYAFRAIWEYYHYRFSGAVGDVPAQSGGGGSGRDHAVTFQLLIGWSL